MSGVLSVALAPTAQVVANSSILGDISILVGPATFVGIFAYNVSTVFTATFNNSINTNFVDLLSTVLLQTALSGSGVMQAAQPIEGVFNCRLNSLEIDVGKKFDRLEAKLDLVLQAARSRPSWVVALTISGLMTIATGFIIYVVTYH